MFELILTFFLIVLLFLVLFFIWRINARKYISSGTVASAYDAWTEDKLLERLWGEHIHLGFYPSGKKNIDFRKAKAKFVHELVRWSELDKLPKGSRILDVGCGIGGSSRILAKHYGFNVTGITISPAQVKRARELTPSGLNCNFQVMDAMDLEFEDGSFDGVWSVEAGAHMNDKTKFADEMLRTLRPGGYLAFADWNSRDLRHSPPSFFENLVLKQLLEQWVHPNFISINEFANILGTNKNSLGRVISENWNFYTNPSWYDSIFEGFRRPFSILSLGPLAIVKSIREIPTILLMNWAFRKGLMEFGVYKCRG
ncbi:2-methyl-6-phytyl-1,4-benzoquinone methyltransferase [Prochlorococcus marinus str. MIT 9321]|uniref:2-methyl-6-phytyl-1,4-benzoquinone methyltransferase n=1 Tax=Prochlorococcus marinus str. MIT 9401 TaxID=167551 RepID=A0A0A2B817_PROMR|nr:methyltransferase domain-containing protein [Prochlorococcus marinus]KGG03077.1 2-methyl-6-phytyl-1,4-benzoquinone methyltransferase [Prochlorococcus marinus str. MIT 9321]KGG06617.1 2-methyl-6-phytyl-1,4-benzoquinone methyltransferase [Prochlorococcus marinus str. MIT 9322]KGG10203.1 2-methyl-6-phytyl-1,4-benzoquinone methyltransferase [Prochlorococcus marinus str. MIT 9401]